VARPRRRVPARRCRPGRNCAGRCGP
jgi:hypothetical protein